MSATNDVMSYMTTNQMFDSYGVDRDAKLKEWQRQVYKDKKTEALMEENLVELEFELGLLTGDHPGHCTFLLKKIEMKNGLDNFRSTMHPGKKTF